MKKLIAILLCGMMMVGSLCVFAEEGIMPLDDCDHENTSREFDSSERDGCTLYVTYFVSCDDCPYSDYFVTEKESHSWVEEIIDGETVMICEDCDAIK